MSTSELTGSGGLTSSNAGATTEGSVSRSSSVAPASTSSPFGNNGTTLTSIPSTTSQSTVTSGTSLLPGFSTVAINVTSTTVLSNATQSASSANTSSIGSSTSAFRTTVIVVPPSSTTSGLIIHGALYYPNSFPDNFPIATVASASAQVNRNLLVPDSNLNSLVIFSIVLAFMIVLSCCLVTTSEVHAKYEIIRERRRGKSNWRTKKRENLPEDTYKS